MLESNSGAKRTEQLAERLQIPARWTSLCLFAFVIISYGGLIGIGRWQADEYVYLTLARQGPSFLLDRLKWSPRPFSEPLFFAYAFAVNHLHRPLIIPFLGMLWLCFLFAALFTVWQRHRDKSSSWPDLLLSLALIALFLAVGNSTEVFYWPAGAAAYIPTLSATFLLWCQICDSRLSTPSGRVLASACLFLAAGSTEAGAMFVLSFAFITALRSGWIRFQHLDSQQRHFWWWVLPTALALAVMIAIRLNRYNVMELLGISKRPMLGRPIESAFFGAALLVKEVFGKQAHLLPVQILLFIGAALFWSHRDAMPPQRIRQIVDLTAALLLASFLTIASANYHFGTLCCDRHQFLRQCWIFMSVAAIGRITGEIARKRHHASRSFSAFAPFLLCAALLAGWQVQRVFQTYLAYRDVYQIAAANFQSGILPGGAAIQFTNVPPSVTVAIPQAHLPPGTYRLDAIPGNSALDVYLTFVMKFFGKDGLVVR